MILPVEGKPLAGVVKSYSEKHGSWAPNGAPPPPLGTSIEAYQISGKSSIWKKSIWKKGPDPARLELSKVLFKVKLSNGSGI